jgi:hypothetical protein
MTPSLVFLVLACTDYTVTRNNDAAGAEAGPGWPDTSGDCVYVDNTKVQAINETPTDILWVIDNSGSMNDNMPAVEDSYGDLTQVLPQFADWKMKPISADPAVAAQDYDDPIDAWSNLGSEWTFPQGQREKPLEALVSYIDHGNASWMRLGANLVVVGVSDEDDQSDFDDAYSTTDEGDYGVITHFSEFLLSVKPSDSLYFTSIIFTDESTCGFSMDAPGYRLMVVADEFNGYVNDLCDDPNDWYIDMPELVNPQGEYEPVALRYIPVVDSIRVTVAGIKIEEYEWEYRGGKNAVHIFDGDVLDGNTPLSVVYRVDTEEYGGECPLGLY